MENASRERPAAMSGRKDELSDDSMELRLMWADYEKLL